ncbi:MAG: arginase family protein [Chitinophagaceae bacterium]|nr:arginase family protein [Chitinophagaceae bacterium]MCW5925890.1 arginase family protein [Chitinophagaceae bacterium]
MGDWQSIIDFLNPVNRHHISHDEGYKEGQIGNIIDIYEEGLPDVDQADIVLIGCGEERGSGSSRQSLAPDVIRSQFYDLYYWHKEIRLADIGNIKCGAGLQDTYAALRTVAGELINAGKTVVILGGSHDLTLAQSDAYKINNRVIEVSVIDALIDIHVENPQRARSFLMEMLTAEPNYIRHYNHIAFQSYFVNPHMLETMDKLRFDCYRLGVVKENMEDMEPVLRNSHMASFDISAIERSAAPSNYLSPNGLNGEQACLLTRFAGMSHNISSLGIYGYSLENDTQQLTAKQIAQMVWYFVDGRWQGRHEARLAEKDSFFEFNTVFGEVDTVFLKSKKTGRWWMQLPDKTYIACSYQDYIQASSNEIPERWLRAQERS